MPKAQWNTKLLMLDIVPKPRMKMFLLRTRGCHNILMLAKKIPWNLLNSIDAFGNLTPLFLSFFLQPNQVLIPLHRIWLCIRHHSGHFCKAMTVRQLNPTTQFGWLPTAASSLTQRLQDTNDLPANKIELDWSSNCYGKIASRTWVS